MGERLDIKELVKDKKIHKKYKEGAYYINDYKDLLNGRKTDRAVLLKLVGCEVAEYGYNMVFENLTTKEEVTYWFGVSGITLLNVAKEKEVSEKLEAMKLLVQNLENLEKDIKSSKE